MTITRYNYIFNKDELIFLGKVLDQRRLYNKKFLKSNLTKDHLQLKKKILDGINHMDSTYNMSIPKRELAYLNNILLQYFISTLKNDLFYHNKKYLHLLKDFTERLGEKNISIFNDLFK